MSQLSAALRLVLVAGVLICTPLPAYAEQPLQLEQMRSFVDLMSRYYALMSDITAVAADPDKNAVLQMTKLKEYLEQSGEGARAEELLRRIADSSERPAVRNAASMMLAEALAQRGNKREAAAVLERALMGASARP